MSDCALVPIFATPFAVVKIPRANQMNSPVTTLLEMRASADADPAPMCGPFQYCSREQSGFEDVGAQALAAEVLAGMRRAIALANHFDEQQIGAWQVQALVSFAIVRTDGYLPPRNFPMTSWCGIYCLEAPSSSPDRRDSGVLRLYEGRLGNVFADATNSAMRVPYATGHYSWRPVPGEVAVFPGSVTHGIAPIRSFGKLVLLVLRLRFFAPGQQGWTNW